LGDNVVELTAEPESTANKARLLRLQDGALVVLWHQEHGAPGGAWDLNGTPLAPRDIFITLSVDGGTVWSPPVNISETAELTDSGAFYDQTGDGTGLANFYGDSGKATAIASGNNLVVLWNDAYCGDGHHGPARYEGQSGFIELPYRCLYAARIVVSSGTINIMGRDRITDATRDVTNEVARATGAGFAMAWQEDPQGLQPGEAYGDGDGASGARVSSGTDIWYSWMPKSSFASATSPWRAPVPVSNNYDHGSMAAISGGASRPNLAMAGSPPTAILIYEEAKGSDTQDVGKYVRYHHFPFNAPPRSEAGIIISDPAENSRRARIVAMSSPGSESGTRMALMWRQGQGIQGAAADFMMRVGIVPAGTDISLVTNAGFRVTDLSPAVDATNPANNTPGLNISAANLSDATSVNPLANAKAHRAVMDGDFIYAAYTLDLNASDGVDQYQFWTRWSDDGGINWAPPAQVSAGIPGSENVIEPRLIRTPGTVQSGKPEDIHNPDTFVLAWGTEILSADSAEPIRDSLFVTRTVDRGLSFERVQAIAPTRTAPGQTDEQIQLRVSPDGENVAAIWIRHTADASDVVFNTAKGITRTADLSVSIDTANNTPDVGETVEVTIEVHNDGPQTATDPELTVHSGNGLTIASVTSASGNCSIAVGASCQFDVLKVNETVVVKLVLVAELQDKWSLTAKVRAMEEEPLPIDNEAIQLFDVIPKADLSVNVTTDKQFVNKDERFQVDYEVTNIGPQTASDVQITLQFPNNATFIIDQNCDYLGTQLICSVPSLLDGASWSHSATFHANNAGIAALSVTATAIEVDPITNNNTANLNVSVADESVNADAEADDSSGGGGGCAYAPHGNDSTLVMLLVVALLWRLRRWHDSNPLASGDA
jgi:uncharacterized repeat protein (TIGR01451 family)